MPANKLEHHDAIVKLHEKTTEHLSTFANLLNEPNSINNTKAFFEAYEGTAVLNQLLDRYIRRGNIMDYRYICQNFMEELKEVNNAN